jgi:hypothetical protein
MPQCTHTQNNNKNFFKNYEILIAYFCIMQVHIFTNTYKIIFIHTIYTYIHHFQGSILYWNISKN